MGIINSYDLILVNDIILKVLNNVNRLSSSHIWHAFSFISFPFNTIYLVLFNPRHSIDALGSSMSLFSFSKNWRLNERVRTIFMHTGLINMSKIRII